MQRISPASSAPSASRPRPAPASRTRSVCALALGIAALITTAFPVPASADDSVQTTAHADWFQDYDLAAAAAQQQGKDLLIDFTGSDWCGWCIRLNEEVFDHQSFLDAIKQDYVLVMLDFPRSPELKARVPNPSRNEQLQEKFKVRGFPTILLATASGDVYGQTGYQQGGPQSYLEHVAELRGKGRPGLVKTLELVARIEAAEGAAKTALLKEAVDALASAAPDAAYATQLVGPARQALAADPATAPGLKIPAARALLKRGESDDELLGLARELDPKNEHGLYEWVVQSEQSSVRSEDAIQPWVDQVLALEALGPLKDPELAGQLFASVSFMSHKYLADADQAKAYAQKVQALKIDQEPYQRLYDMVLRAK